jgi:hypothetical protein
VPRTLARRRRYAAAAFASLVLGAIFSACGALPFLERPANGYVYASNEPLRIAVIDETNGRDWSPALVAAITAYANAAPKLDFRAPSTDAHIVIRVRRYSDANPPAIEGYVFPPGAGGFATVYDVQGRACNYPPSTLPMNCSGEIATATIYLNDAIPAGSDIDARRFRLLVHEIGHALGLTRHAATFDAGQLAQRYGWRSN